MLVVIACLALLSCQHGPSEVADKVLSDFGLREAPEGYVSGSDKVFEQLDVVGAAELKRLNMEQRHGEIKFEGEGRRGQYYKEAKVYESYHPFDVKAATGGGSRDRGYTGVIEYRYRVFQSARKNTSAEAAAESASTPTDEEGREAYRYSFSMGGVWDGARGERARR